MYFTKGGSSEIELSFFFAFFSEKVLRLQKKAIYLYQQTKQKHRKHENN